MNIPKILTDRGFVSMHQLKLGDIVLGSPSLQEPVVTCRFPMDIRKRIAKRLYLVEYSDGHRAVYANGDWILNGSEFVPIDELAKSKKFHSISLYPALYQDAAIRAIHDDPHTRRDVLLSEYMAGAILSSAHGTDPYVTITVQAYQNIYTELQNMGIAMKGIPNGNDVSLQWVNRPDRPDVIYTDLFEGYYAYDYANDENYPIPYIINGNDERRSFLGGVMDALRVSNDRIGEVVLGHDEYVVLKRVQNLLRSMAVYSEIHYNEEVSTWPQYILNNFKLSKTYPRTLTSFYPLQYTYHEPTIETMIRNTNIAQMLSVMGIDNRHRRGWKITRIVPDEGPVVWYDLYFADQPMLYYGEDFIPRLSR